MKPRAGYGPHHRADPPRSRDPGPLRKPAEKGRRQGRRWAPLSAPVATALLLGACASSGHGFDAETRQDFTKSCASYRTGDLATAYLWAQRAVDHSGEVYIEIYHDLAFLQGHEHVDRLTRPQAVAVLDKLCTVVDGKPYGLYS